MSGKATVASFTVNHVPWVPNLPVPYVFAAVELEEQPGLRLSTEIVNIDPEAVSIGMAGTGGVLNSKKRFTFRCLKRKNANASFPLSPRPD